MNLSESLILKNGTVTLFWIVFVFAIRIFAIRHLRKSKIKPIQKQNWITQTKRISEFLVLSGLIVIWSTEIKTFAISLIAVAAAVVIATKELIVCFTGGILKVVTAMYRVGDRIEIHGHRGEVVETDYFTTTLNELNHENPPQFTGKELTLPNSLLWSDVIKKELVIDHFRIHHFEVRTDRTQVGLHQKTLLEMANQSARPYLAEAKAAFESHTKKYEIHQPNPEPRVTLDLSEDDVTRYIVRLAAPAGKEGRIEQEILSNYIEAFPKKMDLNDHK